MWRALCPVGTITLTLLAATGAHALPSTQPDSTYMVDAAVRAIAQVRPPGRDLVWLGGKFGQILKNKTTAVATVGGLAVFDNATGSPAASVHVPILARSSGTPVVFDMALSPNHAVLYIAGQFNEVDGLPRKNVAAIDPVTGTLLPFAPNAQPANSIHATGTNVYVGGVKLTSFRLDGSRTPGFTPTKAIIDPDLRGVAAKAAFRGITSLGSTLVAACQCDSIGDGAGVHQTKAVVQIDASTGALLPWTPSNLEADSAAWGVRAMVDEDPISGLATVYLAAGGSDFAAAYDFASGAQLWKTDLSGSGQALTTYQGALVLAGHFLWSESPTVPQCGMNSAPTPGCYHTPRLVGLDPATGAVVLDPNSGQPWNPGICCVYQGLWAVMTDAGGTSLHVGGEYSKAGGAWTFNASTGVWEIHGFAKQLNYARFSDPPQLP